MPSAMITSWQSNVASVVTAVTLLIGFPVAWLLAIAPRWIGRLVFAILLLSMWTNLLARTFAWMVLLQQTGPINRLLMWLGVIHEPLTLVKGLGVGGDALDLVGNRLMVRPDHHSKPCAGPRGARLQHMRQQRLAGDGVQHFWQRRSHPRALAGRKHDSLAGSRIHTFSSSYLWGHQ